jgi:hypothetical protein
MALITDPDRLSQGTSTAATGVTFGTPTGSTVAISGTGLPAMTAGAYFEIRNANSPENNGLYIETGGSPTTSAITADKLGGDNGAIPGVDAVSSPTTVLHTEAGLDDEKSVYIDFYNREMWLLKQGNLSNDGSTLQAIYSFTKEEWKNDPQLIPHPYPFTAITPEQFELTDNWVFRTGNNGATDLIQDVETRKLIRTGGWREIGTDDIIDQEYVGVISLGQFEDNANDTAYYQNGNDPTDTGATINFGFAGPVNEAVQSYSYTTTTPGDGFVITTGDTITRSTGSWIADGYKLGGQITVVTSDTVANIETWEIISLTTLAIVVQTPGLIADAPLTNDADDTIFTAAVNNRNILNVFLRIRDGDVNGKTYAQATLGDIGVSEVVNQVYRFPITNSTDLKITATDATISGSSPYTQIVLRYFNQSFEQEVESGVTSNFGIVVDVGTHSGVDGGITSAGSSLTTVEGGIPIDGTYDGGTLTIWNTAGTTAIGTYIIGTVVSATAVPITTTFPETDTNVSFTLQRATPITATAEQIYEKVQYSLRQALDVDLTTSGVVVGNTADALLRFVGDTLEAGQAIPNNPNGGGSGVAIQGFDSNDTNRIVLFDNAGINRSFPFVAAGTINFNNNLQNDTDAKFWMFFTYTVRTTTTNAVNAAVSGRNVTFTTTAGAIALPVLVENQYIRVGGYPADTRINGIYRVTTFTDTTTGGFVAYKTSLPDSAAITTDTGSGVVGFVLFDENPIDSPDAIIVENNSGTPITAIIGGASSFGFDFDYDNNSQGERVAGQGNAAITIRAIGFNSAQFVETSGTIVRATGQSFTLVSALERNYLNAA